MPSSTPTCCPRMWAPWSPRCPAGTAASTSWGCHCVKHARSSSANIWLRRSVGSAAISPGPPNSSAWSARHSIASSRRSVSIEDSYGASLVRSAYVNGRYLPGAQATVHVEDRGYQFSDGVYEVCEVRDSHIIDEQRHMARLSRSLHELRIPMPMSDRALKIVMRECLHRNRVHDGIIYLQITRGVARRDHAFPAPDTKPCLVVTARSLDRAANERMA